MKCARLCGMQGPMKRLLVLPLVVLALTACPDPAKNKPKAEVSTTPVQQVVDLPALGGAVPYTFSNADSKLLWTGAKVSKKHPGGFNAFSGLVELVDQAPAKSRVRVDIDMTSVFTDAPKLVGHLKSPDFFDVAQFARSTFVSDAVVPKADAPGTFDVSGTLTLHGVSKRLTFPAAIAVEGDTVKVKAEFALNRKDFGVVYPGAPDDLIADEVLIALDLAAKKKG